MKLLKSDSSKIWLPVLGLLIAGFYTAWLFVPPASSKSLTIATGREGGAYHQFAEQYQAGLKADGVSLEIQTTAGSVEALQLLQDNKVDLAFVQGGVVGEETDTAKLSAVGSLFYEPLWVFLPKDSAASIDSLKSLSGGRIAVGNQGSGTRELALTLLKDNGVSSDNSTLLMISDFTAIGHLFEKGQLDAAFFVSAPQSEAIKALSARTDLQIMNFSRYARAYSGHYPFLANIILGEGIINLQRGMPDQALTLLAPTATLLATSTVHSDHIRLLARETLRVHSGAGLLQDSGQFPSIKHLDVPVHPDAKQYFEQGPSFLEKYLPFPIATKLDQFKIMLIPLLTLLFPLIKGILPLYKWRIRSRTYRWYKDLNQVDRELDSFDLATVKLNIDNMKKMHGELAQKVSVPLSYMSELYTLRMHTNHIRERLEERKKQLSAAKKITDTKHTDYKENEKFPPEVNKTMHLKADEVRAQLEAGLVPTGAGAVVDINATADIEREVDVVKDMAMTTGTVEADSGSMPEQSADIIKKYAARAMALSLIPVPVLDIAALTGLQLTMLHRLCEYYGVSFNRKRAKSLLVATVSGVLPTVALMTLSSASKVIPGVGTLAGNAGLSVSSGMIVYVTGLIFTRHFESGGTLADFNTTEQKNNLRQALKTHEIKAAVETIN